MSINLVNLNNDVSAKMELQKTEELKKLNSKAGSGKKEDVEKAAQGFETMMIKQMLNTMTKSLENGGFFGEMPGSDFYQEMYMQKISETMSRQGHFGIADMIKRQMTNDYTNLPIKSVMPEFEKTATPRDKETTPREKEGVKEVQAVKVEKSESTPKTLLSRLNFLEPIITKAANLFHVEKNLIKAIIAQESYGNGNAVSKSGAKGLMQLMDGTAKDLGVTDPHNAEQNIMAGTKYIKQMLDKYQDKEVALAAYNAGPGNVDKHGGIPPFKETRNYVKKVITFYENME